MEGLPDLAALREHFGRVFSGFSDAPEEFDDAHEVARDPPQPPGDKELREQPAGFGQQTVVTATAAGDFCGLQWTAVESLGPELSHLQAAPLAKKRDRGDGDSERRDGGEETTKRAKIDQMPLNVYFRLHWRLALLRTRAPNPSALPMCRICCTSCTR